MAKTRTSFDQCHRRLYQSRRSRVRHPVQWVNAAIYRWIFVFGLLLQQLESAFCNTFQSSQSRICLGFNWLLIQHEFQPFEFHHFIHWFNQQSNQLWIHVLSSRFRIFNLTNFSWGFRNGQKPRRISTNAKVEIIASTPQRFDSGLKHRRKCSEVASRKFCQFKWGHCKWQWRILQFFGLEQLNISLFQVLQNTGDFIFISSFVISLDFKDKDSLAFLGL